MQQARERRPVWLDLSTLLACPLLDNNDRARLDVYARELSVAVLVHAAACDVCCAGRWCDSLTDALETLLGWYDGRARVHRFEAPFAA